MFTLSQEHLTAILKRMAVQRPLHWSEALMLIEDLQYAHEVIAKLEALVPPKPEPEAKPPVAMSTKGKTIDWGTPHE